MSKKRGKRRPPKIGPAREGVHPVVITQCRTCPELVSKESLVDGICYDCRRSLMEAANTGEDPRDIYIRRKQFDTGARGRGRRYQGLNNGS